MLGTTAGRKAYTVFGKIPADLNTTNKVIVIAKQKGVQYEPKKNGSEKIVTPVVFGFLYCSFVCSRDDDYRNSKIFIKTLSLFEGSNSLPVINYGSRL